MLTEVAHLRISPAVSSTSAHPTSLILFLKLYSYVDLLGAVVVFAFVISIYLAKQYYPKKLCHKKNITKKISSRKIENTFQF